MSLFDFSSFPVLTTPRLVLRELTPGDADDVFRVRGDREAQRYNSPMSHVSEADTVIEALRAAYTSHDTLYWGITSPAEKGDRVVGLAGFNYWDKEHRRAMLGFELARTHWGKGLGTEAVNVLIQFGFDRMQLNRIDSVTLAGNSAALRLLERVGFQREGTIREHSWQDGAYHDLALYGLLRSECVGATGY